MIKNLMGYNGNKIANQFVITMGENVYFQSYESLVAKKEGTEITLGKDWSYSRTTMKYLCKFLADYCEMPGMNKALIKKYIERGTLKYDRKMK